MFDLPRYVITPHDIAEQARWSAETFGPGPRTTGITQHIAKELEEIHKDPSDLSEWVDVMILAVDGAWRAGHTPHQILAAYHAKIQKNMNRTWPDWRGFSQDEAIEHDRSADLKHSESCTIENRRDGWYPADCPLCEDTTRRINNGSRFI